jgi:hypothetical protein
LNFETDEELICSVLEEFAVVDKVDQEKIENLRVVKSKLYGMCDVFEFDFNGNHYYISNDYSLNDNPKYFEEILLDINHLLRGDALKNPNHNSELKYSVNIEDSQYYLWLNK